MTLEIVTRCTVRDALRHLSRDRSPGETPLAQLETIKRSLAVAGFRATEGTCRFEIARLLGEISEQELLRLRAVVIGREHAVLAEPLDPGTTMERLLSDFAHDHPDLEGASAVYHLYIRTDLGLGLLDLVALLGDRHRRTLQRRLQRGVRLITSRLRELEREAQMNARDQRLTRRVPPAPSPFIARHALLARLQERLEAENEGPWITALRGEAGIGKTALAIAHARSALETERVDDVAWVDVRSCLRAHVHAHDNAHGNGDWDGSIDDPVAAAAEIVRSAVAQSGIGLASRTLSSGGAMGLGGLGGHWGLGGRRVLVVIDGLECPGLARDVARRLAGVDGPSSALLVGRVSFANSSVQRVLDVPPLSRSDAISFLRHEVARRGMAAAAKAADEALAPIVGAAGGHPGALKSAAAMLRSLSTGAVAKDLERGEGEAGIYFAELWKDEWSAAPPDSRAVVRAVLGSAGATLTIRDRERPSERFVRALRDTVDRGMLVREGGLRPKFRAARFLGRYVRRAERPVAREIIDREPNGHWAPEWVTTFEARKDGRGPVTYDDRDGAPERIARRNGRRAAAS